MAENVSMNSSSKRTKKHTAQWGKRFLHVVLFNNRKRKDVSLSRKNQKTKGKKVIKMMNNEAKFSRGSRGFGASCPHFIMTNRH